MSVRIVTWDNPGVLSHIEKTPVALALGVFDGVHRGHQELLRRVSVHAHHDHATPAVLTFDPNPARVTRPDQYPGDITSLEERITHFARYGMELVYVVRFSSAFAELPGREFLDVLMKSLPDLRTIVVGFNFHLGRHRDIGPERLRLAMEPHRIRVDIVTALKDNNGSISSSRIRRAVAAGELEQVSHMLGRPYGFAVDGTLPSTIGECRHILPPPGTYACTITSDRGDSREGMMSISTSGELTWEWEQQMTNIRYVMVRSTSDGIDC